MCDKKCSCDRKCEPRVPSRDEYRAKLDALCARLQEKPATGCLLQSNLLEQEDE